MNAARHHQVGLADTDVHAMVAELTRPHAHRVRYAVTTGHTTYRRSHNTRVPSLLAQLRHADPTGEGSTRSGAGFESRPALRVEAYDTFVRIDVEAARWVRDLGEDDPGSTTACVRLLASLLPSAEHCGKRPKRDCCTRHAVEHDIRRWWTQARVITGWDAPSWRPDATCPVCGVRGGLRVRLEERSGLCVECRETWGPATYQELAEHVRVEAEERRQGLAGPAFTPVARGQNRGW